MTAPAKITNAFKKIYEIFRRFYKRGSEIKMFDIASAPCMFIICAEMYFKSVQWECNSLEASADNFALADTYGVISSNKDKYHSGDITVKQIRDNISENVNKRFELVSGDIGAPSSGKLQEEEYIELQWGQFILAMKLCDTHGNIALKMYSLITYNSAYIVDLSSIYFERVEIVKPYTSKIFNYECYLLGINRNTTPFTEPEFPNNRMFKSPNFKILEEYEKQRVADKKKLAELYLRIHDKNWSANAEYKDYLQEFHDLYDEINHMRFYK
jgi:hypothetical protein